MINKQKLWFLTLFSLILVLSVYYITMPSELLTTSGKTNKEEKEVKEEAKVNVSETDPLTILQVVADVVQPFLLFEVLNPNVTLIKVLELGGIMLAAAIFGFICGYCIAKLRILV